MDYREATSYKLPFGDRTGFTLEQVGRAEAGLRYLEYLQSIPAMKNWPGLAAALETYLKDENVAARLQQARDMEIPDPSIYDQMPANQISLGIDRNPWGGSGKGTTPESEAAHKQIQELFGKATGLKPQQKPSETSQRDDTIPPQKQGFQQLQTLPSK